VRSCSISSTNKNKKQPFAHPHTHTKFSRHILICFFFSYFSSSGERPKSKLTTISGASSSVLRYPETRRVEILRTPGCLFLCLQAVCSTAFRKPFGVSAANPAGPHHAGVGAELSPPTEKAENGTSTACQIRRTDELRVPLYRRMSAPPAFCADASGSQSCLARQDVVQSLAGVELDGTAATKNNLILIET